MPDGSGVGKLLVVTGGGRGIGRTVAEAAVEDGYRVAVVDIDEVSGRAVVAQLVARGGDAHFLRCDVGRPDDIAAVFGRIESEIGVVDVLVNNAARGSHTAPEDLTPEEWNSVLAVSLGSMVFASQAVGRSMIRDGRRGAIVNLSSIGGLAALGRGNFAYSIAKAGIVGMTRELAVEWAGFGIRVNAIAPSQVDTEGFRALVGDVQVADGQTLPEALRGIPLGRLAAPDDIAAAVLFLAGDRASFITGVTLPVDGGSMALHAGGSVRRPVREEEPVAVVQR